MKKQKVKKIDCGEYVAGLSFAGKALFVNAIHEGDDLVFYKGKKEIGRIPVEKIQSVIVDDKTTIQKRITATRVFALGLFALAFQKKTKNVEYGLVIEYDTGAAAFEFNGIGAQLRANVANAELQKILAQRA